MENNTIKVCDIFNAGGELDKAITAVFAALGGVTFRDGNDGDTIGSYADIEDFAAACDYEHGGRYGEYELTDFDIEYGDLVLYVAQ